ncbi:sensor histidine kinase [Actinocorallia longicatena]|uniref:histidine kinase n=1 Tax=Actinocorallia longicatena TaxID=111803 RepID=A0ABP6Q914_9ACTN
MSQPVPWVPPVLYGAVLSGGVYYDAVGPGLAAATAAFAGLLTGLILLDLRPPALPATVVFVARILVLCGVSAVDASGLSRVLFVLVPFLGYFAYGPVVAAALGTGCVTAVAAAFTLFVPQWWTRAEYISDLLMFALGVVLATSMAAVAVRERTARERVAELSAAAERNRIAREIHDSLGHHLTALGVQLETALAFGDLDPPRAAQAVTNARWSAGQALEEVRTSVRTLADGPLDLGGALEELVRRLDGGPRRVTLTVSGEERRPLLVLYRAAQEGLANACRHSAATEIGLSVLYDDRGACLRVTDDGRGFETAGEGFGLRALRERVALADGTVDIVTSPAGTVVKVDVPW